jgi:hypothetical protein
MAALPILPLLLVANAGLGAAQGTAERSGDAVVVSADDSAHEVAGGGSQTEFSLKLPDGAVCPGDSANDNYRLQSFLIPAGADPGAIVWRSIGPDGPDQIALYGTDTNQFVQALTEMNPGPGQPGIIPAIPPLSFGTYAPTDLLPGAHRMGIACTLYNTTTNYWDVDVDLARDSSDQPAEIHWTITGSAAGSSSASSSTIPLVAGGFVVVAVGAGAYLFSRRRRSDPSRSLTKETL